MSRQTFFLSVLMMTAACSKAPDVATRKKTIPDPVKEPAAFELFSADDDRNFTSLPMRGDVRDQKHFWSDDYWALNKGNINRRWNAPVRVGFNHRSPTRDELMTMTQEKIATYAPSEKYDMLMGAFDYPLRKEVNQLAANQNAELWEGMVNGWAVASLLHIEPSVKTLKNPDGIDIPFGSEDIKGLLGYYYMYHQPPEVSGMVGKPCMERGCAEDVTAASFHMALANSLGKKKQAFLMDIDRTRDMWNHPVVAFTTEYRGNADMHDGATPGTYSIIRLKTTVTYIDEALNQVWGPILGTTNQLETQQIYQYWLHLDVDGNIIGGEWKSNERPDYLWTVKAPAAFDGILAGLTALIDDPQVVVTEETHPEETSTDGDVVHE